MLCKIAELITVVPEAGGMAPRCKEYIFKGDAEPDIVIDETRYRPEIFPEGTTQEMISYMESGSQFCARLIQFGGIYLHSSAIELDGQAYLFSGPSGMGKSTHTRLWQQVFGPAAQVFNDDKPVLRHMDGNWYAYGTPWCGKDGINQNKKVPLAGICFLKQAQKNKIRQLSKEEALQKILSQTMRKFRTLEYMDPMLRTVGKLVADIPVYELENRPEPEAALLSHKTMCCNARRENHEIE